MNLSAVLSLLIVCAPFRAASQDQSPADSARIVILSDSVGPVITPDERRRYHLFSQFDGFDRAVVLLLRDSSFAVLFTLNGRGGSPRDTLVTYSGTTILMLSEKIDHFEEVQNGSYAWGRTPTSLRLAPGSVPIAPGSLPPAPVALLRPALAGRSTDTLRPAVTPPRAPSVDTVVRMLSHPLRQTPYGFESLPLARGSALRMPRFYPAFAVGFGIRTFSPDISGLSPVTGGNPSISFSPVIDVMPELLVNEEIGIRAEGGFTPGDVNCTIAAISVVLYAHPFDNPGIRPFLEVGYVRTSFGGEVNNFQFTSGGGGARLGAGIEFQLGSLGGIALDVCYDRIARKYGWYTFWQEGDPLTKPVVVDPGSIQFGFTIKIQ